MRLPWLVGVVCCVAAAFRCASGEEVSGVAGISFSPGDAFHVDGDLSDWREVPKPISLCTRDQVVWGADAWADPGDLSAGIRLAWSEKSLFLAVDVTDDILRQTQRGGGSGKGITSSYFWICIRALNQSAMSLVWASSNLDLAPAALNVPAILS